MDLSQAFYRCLSRTMAHSPRCQNIVSTSRPHLNRPSSRRKHITQPAHSRTREFSALTRKLAEGDSNSGAHAKPQPARSIPSTNPRETASSPPRTKRPGIFDNLQINVHNPKVTSSLSSPSDDAPSNRRKITDLLDMVDPPKPRAPASRISPFSGDSFYGALSGTPRPLPPSTSSLYSSSAPSSNPTADVLASLNERDLAIDAEASKRLRLKPTLGRTVAVNFERNVDLTRAFRMLEFKNNQNSVRTDDREQKYHVRKGQMRKIMRRRRWRKTFLEGFLGECATIRRMRRQGW